MTVPLSPSLSCDTVTSRCQYYRDVLRLPAAVSPCGNRIVMRSDLVSGLVLPYPLAERACECLAEREALGPVVGHMRAGRATILTCWSEGSEFAENPALLRLNVTCAVKSIVLPTPADEQSGYRRWIVQPHSTFLPSMHTAVAAVLAVAT
ncbi:hypothetical protein [Nocardia sp. IFM 10818]